MTYAVSAARPGVDGGSPAAWALVPGRMAGTWWPSRGPVSQPQHSAGKAWRAWWNTAAMSSDGMAYGGPASPDIDLLPLHRREVAITAVGQDGDHDVASLGGPGQPQRTGDVGTRRV